MQAITRRWFWIPTALQTTLGVALCFIPLFDLLGYEFSLATALLAAPASAVIGHGVSRSWPTGRGRPWGTVWLLSLLHLLPTFLAISLNAGRVRNCDYGEGLLFFIALPVATALYGGTLGATIATLFESRRARYGALALGLIFPLALRILALYSEPQIFVFDHLWGHFAGSLYDERISLDSRMGWLRGGTVLRIVLLVVISEVARRSALRERRWTRQGGALLMFFVACTLYDGIVGSATGFRVGRSDIESTLSVIEERPGLQVFMPADTTPEQADLIADYHVFWIERIRETLGVHGPERVRSYVYASRDQKARLMGGRGTMVAKPWLGEIHVHGLDLPHKVIPHELVHVLAAELGSPPFAVTAHAGILIDMGIVEGLAEATTPPRGDYDLHHWVRALRVLDRAPDVRRLVAVTDFWRAPPARAYTVMGSFIRYLLDTRGAEPVRKLYAHGDFNLALGAELDPVVEEWERFIDGLELSDREKRAAEERFRRSSIFRRVCAHEIAQLRNRAKNSRGPEAVATYEQIATYLGNTPNARYDLALAALASGDQARFRALADTLLGDQAPLVSAWRATQLREKLGELAWQDGDLQKARARFREALEQPSTLASERLQWVRLWALEQDREPRDFFARFLAGKLPRASAVLELDALRRAEPSDPTISYLLARQLEQAGDPDRALELLRAIAHPFLPIEVERQRLVGELLEKAGKLSAAAEAFDRTAELLPLSGVAARTAARADWLRWRAKRSAAASR